jgi:hypothetical protein
LADAPDDELQAELEAVVGIAVRTQGDGGLDEIGGRAGRKV